MKEYEIWEQGYRGVDEHVESTFHGKGFGVNFIDACEKFKYDNGRGLDLKRIPIKDIDGGQLYLKNGHPVSCYGCLFFDNKEDAKFE